MAVNIIKQGESPKEIKYTVTWTAETGTLHEDSATLADPSSMTYTQRPGLNIEPKSLRLAYVSGAVNLKEGVKVFLLDSNNEPILTMSQHQEVAKFKGTNLPSSTSFSNNATGEVNVAVGASVASNGTASGDATAGDSFTLQVCFTKIYADN